MHTDNPYKCDLLKEDYVECLHHRKEVSGGDVG
jgi:singapore isolate B (sub-type 7) whole genome shotgun sequence assembly, scaffold_12